MFGSLVGRGYAGEGKVVVLLEPTLYGEEMAGLGVPLYEMLKIRLSARGYRVVEGKGQRMTQGLIEEAEADFVVEWSVTRLGGNISMDARVYRKGSEEGVPVYGTVSFEEIIPGLDSLADGIVSDGFGEGSARRAFRIVEKPAPGTVERKGKPSSQEVRLGEQKPLWSGEGLEIRDGSAGDLDGDGRDEIVIIEESRAHVLSYRDGGLTIVQTLSIPEYSFSVSIADINGNGREEVFVSAYDGYIKSTVLEWKDDGLEVLIPRIGWFLRVLDVPEKGKVLFGQRASFNGRRTGDVYELTWNGREYVRKGTVRLPKGGEVYNFAYIEIEEEPAIVVLSDDTLRLSLYTEDGTFVTESTERYGGTLNTYEADRGVVEGGDEELELDEAVTDGPLRFRVPQRMVWLGGGRVLVIRNIPKGILRKAHRGLKEGEVVVVEYDGVSLREVDRTERLPFYIASVTIGDVDGQGMEAMAIGARGLESLLGKVKAFIVGFPF